MKPEGKELEQRGRKLFEPLANVQARNPQKANSRRRQFIAEASSVLAEISPVQPVSISPFQRLNGWIAGIINPFNRKERVSMFSILTAVVVTLSILFGGAGATVYAAQGSLPTDTLYPVKIFSEDLRVNLAAEPQGQLNVLLDLADRRVDEIGALVAQGEPVPEEVMTRFQSQMQSAYQIAAGLEGDGQIQASPEFSGTAYNRSGYADQRASQGNAARANPASSKRDGCTATIAATIPPATEPGRNPLRDCDPDDHRYPANLHHPWHAVWQWRQLWSGSREPAQV
jgi:hypothetical protein